ncbi:hypothetical protein [Vibrio rotiferianus]|uniref:hypothetical protein n=1 Tax=Vibrio rotiferianus TaxID=190895 RepID=UPI0028940E0E|nr:conserved hypothetical protein [Vibrio rotiferianus]CAH1559497.1 conserved hypothetical protein [Vibrio rotiferianus]
MSYPFKLNNSHIGFLFDDDDYFNVFNLVRILKNDADWGELFIDVCDLDSKYQSSIVSKFSSFINVYSSIKKIDIKCASLMYSNVDQKMIDIMSEKQEFIQDNKTLIFDINISSHKNNPKDPHYVKNVRGAILLSLVQDLMSVGKFGDKVTIFDKRSPILLHSASSFLHNEENAKIMWQMLNYIESEDRFKNRAEINRRINVSLRERRELITSLSLVTRKLSDDSTLNYLVDCLKKKLDLPRNIYLDKNKINLWFVDDQQANGWFRLMSSMIPSSHIEIKPLNGKGDVEMLLALAAKTKDFEIPDLALVDLRLTSSDDQVEKYNPQDLSGFEVVKRLLDEWVGLSVMIASASSKLWNMEKAIEKGAVAYWRKSDELLSNEIESPILTAFDIHSQFVVKLMVALERVKYKYIFKIMEIIRSAAKSLGSSHKSLQLAIENYFRDIEQKTVWMCWTKTSETKINDSLCLGVMEIFNELENILWDPDTDKLILFPNKKVQRRKKNTDSKVINDTLDCMDNKYGIGGFGLLSQYEKFKGIRNKLPTIHGSHSGQDIKHATIINIETSLLIIWSLLRELNLVKV